MSWYLFPSRPAELPFGETVHSLITNPSSLLCTASSLIPPASCSEDAASDSVRAAAGRMYKPHQWTSVQRGGSGRHLPPRSNRRAWQNNQTASFCRCLALLGFPVCQWGWDYCSSEARIKEGNKIW